jgi:2-hydroxychromene-2-carboxylate isomerase
MTLSVDLFYSFRSPYSYLALPKIVKMVAHYDLAVKLRPVYPLAVRVPGFFKKTNPQFLPYVSLDAPRVAQHENISYRFPRPDPNDLDGAGNEGSLNVPTGMPKRIDPISRAQQTVTPQFGQK